MRPIVLDRAAVAADVRAGVRCPTTRIDRRDRLAEAMYVRHVRGPSVDGSRGEVGGRRHGTFVSRRRRRDGAQAVARAAERACGEFRSTSATSASSLVLWLCSRFRSVMQI